MSTPMKCKVRVTIIKELELEFTEQFLDGMTEEEFLKEFSKSLWPVDDMEDVFKYAARMAAAYGSGYTHDGLGLVLCKGGRSSKPADVIFDELDEDIEEEMLELVMPEDLPPQ